MTLPIASHAADVREVAMRPGARARSSLPRIDYEDAFEVDTSLAQSRTPEQWARVMLEDASPGLQRSVRVAWALLGFRLGSIEDPSRVLGWEVRRSTPEFVVLGGHSRLGLHGELLLERHDDSLFFATFLRLHGPVARAMWTLIAPLHRQVAPYALARGVRRVEATTTRLPAGGV